MASIAVAVQDRSLAGSGGAHPVRIARSNLPAIPFRRSCSIPIPVRVPVHARLSIVFDCAASCAAQRWRRSSVSAREEKRGSGSRIRLRRTQALYVDDDGDYLVDAPVSVGDGFSFSGGKYSDNVGRASQWFSRGQIRHQTKAYPVQGGLEKAKDPYFGLPMGESSQVSEDFFRWFYVEEGDPNKPAVVLLHGFPSQAYSYRNVIEALSADYHVIALDWLGFGFSDKPQAKYGFNYTSQEYATGLGLLLTALGLESATLVVQGYFAPAVVQFAKESPTKVDHLILINPPVTESHVKLPSQLATFSAFLLGEIFAQDPLKASDKPLTECGPYALDEEDAEVYRRPYLTSGSSGFALTALSRVMKSELKNSVSNMKKTLTSSEWTKPISIIWGKKDRWLDFQGVEEFSKLSRARLVQLAEVGHHAQEDFGEEVGQNIKALLRRTVPT